jgi:A/G-specific adenine glycosylase
VVQRVAAWYPAAARDLPWRRQGTTPWAVLVSEAMLQQTPVARVEPVWQAWMLRWPTPRALAADAPGDAVRAWGRLGYPRRALRLHAAAVTIVARHGGAVPSSYDELRALPGVGDYTAAAVASFAFGAAVPVLDTNVRRVYARVFDGTAEPAANISVGERRASAARVPAADGPRYSVAVMELGAIVCTARGAACERCPVREGCAWHAAGRPVSSDRRRRQTYVGTDRQARGRLLSVLRDAPEPVDEHSLAAAWDDEVQRGRALAGLLADGLVEASGDGRFRLPA